MSTLEKLSELESRRTAIITKSNEIAKKTALAQGKLTARERVSTLLDENSFVEVGTFITSRSTAFNMRNNETPADGVVTGYGTVKGSPVYVYSQDASVLGGALGEMHAKKIVRIYEEAIKVGAPVVGFLDTVGVRLQESVDALEGYGMIYEKMIQASEIVPQIAVIVGDCAGGAAFVAGLSDFVFMSSKSARVFLNSPNTLDDKAASFDTIATAKVHFEKSGLATVIKDQEETLIEDVCRILSYLPQNSVQEGPFYEVTDDINRVEASLNNFDFEKQKIKDIVISIVDTGEVLVLNEAYGKTVLTAFARMDGGTVGIIANTETRMDYAGVKKVANFVRMCDTYNIPIVTLTDIEGFASTIETEQLGIIKACSEMTKAFAQASVPKVNVILRYAFGSGYLAMNSKSLGCDMTYAWPTATVTCLNTDSAMKIMYAKELEEGTLTNVSFAEKAAEYDELQASAYAAAARGLIDDIIEPAATRKRIIAALEVLATKER